MDKPREYIELMTHAAKEVIDLDFVSDGYISMKWRNSSDCTPVLPHSSIVTAAFTTSYARLKLFNLMNELGERLLYCDTDSVIFSAPFGVPVPPTDSYLGGLTNEVGEEQGGSIVEFASSGPKSYAYKTRSGDTVTKIRGFTLSFDNAKQLNFSSMKRVVTEGGGERIETEKHGIVRDAHSRLFSRTEKKVFRSCFDKRIVTAGLNTYPFGWEGEELPESL